MSLINNDIDFELNYYIRIIDYFQKGNIEYRKAEIWRSKALIELMEFFKRTRNRTLVTNALLLLISLFEDKPPDIYNNCGEDAHNISKEERKIFIAELKNEFLPN
ncbi:MAG: hypothetical protein ACFFAQ_09220 [Promethearchaeota archaeon]